ncbi:hypothetical protein KI387_003119, partial [Taxus chinensis]
EAFSHFKEMLETSGLFQKVSGNWRLFQDSLKCFLKLSGRISRPQKPSWEQQYMFGGLKSAYDLPYPKTLGGITTGNAIKLVRRRSRRRVSGKVHFCVHCNLPIPIYHCLAFDGRLVAAIGVTVPCDLLELWLPIPYFADLLHVAHIGANAYHESLKPCVFCLTDHRHLANIGLLSLCLGLVRRADA